MAEYIPGVCNINRAEISSRRKAGYIGLVMVVGMLAVLFGLGLPRYTRVLMFIPFFITVIGFLQAHNKFCVGYAAAGLQNTDEHSDQASSIGDQDAQLADKTRARHMNIQALITSLVLAIIIVLV